MKIILITTTVTALLAIGIISINNNSILGNVFAQEGDSEIPPLVEPDRNISMMTLSPTTNQSQPMMMMNWTGTIDVKSTIGEAFKSKVTVNIIDAINVAQTMLEQILSSRK